MAREENMNGRGNGEASEYMSVNQAAAATGVDAGVIRRAMKDGRVHTKPHPWGVRVSVNDVLQLRRTGAGSSERSY